jgi:hypothetical protein
MLLYLLTEEQADENALYENEDSINNSILQFTKIRTN